MKSRREFDDEPRTRELRISSTFSCAVPGTDSPVVRGYPRLHCFHFACGDCVMRTLMKFVALAVFAGACGCSVHPIQDRVTELKTHEIINKIRCEAKEAVESVYNGAMPTLYKGKVLAREAAGYKRISDELAKAQDELKKLNAEALRLKEKRVQIQARDDFNRLRLEKATADAQGDLLRPQTDTEREKSAQRLIAIQNEVVAEDRRLKSIAIQFKFDALASARKISAQSLLAKNIEGRRKSEYADTMNFLKHRMAYQVQFKVTEKNTGKSNASFKVPLPLGSVTIDQINGGDDRERIGDRNVRIVAGFQGLIEMVCGAAAETGNAFPPYPIVGNIGLAEVIQQYMEISVGRTKADFQKDKSAEAYTDKISFKTTVSGGVTPKITITQVTGHTFTGSLDFSGSRTDEHVVFLNLSLEEETKTDGDPDKITKVQIVKGAEF